MKPRVQIIEKQFLKHFNKSNICANIDMKIFRSILVFWSYLFTLMSD